MSYLFDDWWEYVDESSNKKYFYNTKTQATTWEKPKQIVPVKPPPPPKIPESIPEPKVEEQTQKQEVTKSNVEVNELKSPRKYQHERSISDYSEVLHRNSILKTPEKVEPLIEESPTKKQDDDEWVEIFDKTKQKPYYYNLKTKKTQWKKPDIYKPYERSASILIKTQSGANLLNSPGQTVTKEEVEEVYEPFLFPNFTVLGEDLIDSMKGILIPFPKVQAKKRDLQVSPKNTIEVYAKSSFKPRNNSFFKKDSIEETVYWQKSTPKTCYHSFTQDEEKIILSYYEQILLFTQTPNSEILTKILKFGMDNTNYRNELYIYVVKQVNGNPNSQFTLRGLRLLTALIASFLPTKKELTEGVYLLILELTKSQDSTMKDVAISCEKRLLSQMGTGIRKTLPSINVLKDILLGKPPLPIFGVTIEEYSEWQHKRFPNYKSIFILDILIKQLYAINAFKVEGIFRITGEASNIEAIMDQFSYGNFKIESTDPHVLSSLLKIWLRELAEPIVPYEFYDECISVSESKEKCVAVISKFPKLNQSVLLYVFQFLGLICNDDFYNHTKMSIENISVVFAPNILRNTKNSDPRMMLLNSTFEAKFVKNLILSVQE